MNGMVRQGRGRAATERRGQLGRGLEGTEMGLAAKHSIGKARQGEERLGNQWQGLVFTKHMEPNNGNF